MKMDIIVEKYHAVIAIHDDIAVYGKNKKDHNANLLNLMVVAAKNSLLFSSSKCEIKKPSITFLLVSM